MDDHILKTDIGCVTEQTKLQIGNTNTISSVGH